MSDNTQGITAALVGAVVGAAVGFLLFSEQGRAFRRRVEPMLEDADRELNSLRGAVARASSVANEGWRLLNETVGEAGGRDSGARYANPQQASPF